MKMFFSRRTVAWACAVIVGLVLLALCLQPFLEEELNYRRLSTRVEQFRPAFEAHLSNEGITGDRITLYTIKAGKGIVAIGGVGQHGPLHDRLVEFMRSSALSGETLYFSTGEGQ